MKILLDYFFPIAAIEPTPQASTAFLKQVCLVVSPKEDTVGTPVLCTSMAEVAALTDNTDAQQLFNAGMNRVWILPMFDLDLSHALEGHGSDFYTVLISSDWTYSSDIADHYSSMQLTITDYANLISGTPDTFRVGDTVFTAQAGAVTPGEATFRAATSNDATADSLRDQINAHAVTALQVLASSSGSILTVTALALGHVGIETVYTDNDTNVGATQFYLELSNGGLYMGTFKGVVGLAVDDDTIAAAHAAIPNRCAFHTTSTNKTTNMCYAFGKFLSNPLNWTNQQYIAMPVADDVETVGAAEALFDAKVSFVISDDEFGERLALFCAGGKAIAAPYIKKNLEIDLQSRALTYVSANQPDYTRTQAALLEDELKKVIQLYVETRKWISDGTVGILLEQDNFVASAEINIAEPRALWRIVGEMRQTL